MERIETKRLVLRRFASHDWYDLVALAADWKAAPGPEFDKLPTDERECRELTEYLASSNKYFAVCIRREGGVIGLIALNGRDETGRFDLGHIIHSRYQDDDHDREALAAAVQHIFESTDVAAIATHNSDHPPQLAPLRSLGFKDSHLAGSRELTLDRAEWEGSLSGTVR